MTRRFQIAVAAAALSGLAGFATAKDAALLVTQSDYRYLEDVVGVKNAETLERRLTQEGFTFLDSESERADDTWDAISVFRTEAEDAERLLIFLSGRFANNGDETWLITRYAEDVDDLSIGGVGVPLSAILRSVADHPDRALVLLAPQGSGTPLGAGLLPGVGPIEAPEGVGVLIGPADGLVRFVDKIALTPDAKMRSALRANYPAVEVFGDVADNTPFTRGELSNAERAEAALGLTRSERRNVQRDLTILGHSPGGIDGIFGRGSRAAIEAWQKDQGHETTGYLNARQIKALQRQASRRAAELEEAARERAAEETRQDNAFWNKNGKDGSAKGLLAYLKKYPDGLHSDEANEALAKLQGGGNGKASKIELENWNIAKAKDTVQAYDTFLRRHPNGYFSAVAANRIEELKQAQRRQAEQKALAAAEASLLKNGPLRLIVEQRLSGQGFKTGQVDGAFDAQTRKALRQYQKSRGLAVTGFVDQITFARLMINM
ncbi:Putative peptidoglycan binding domain-containing protein [Aliiroseovarius sediminilitoris]|uniref:Putative peptidoglycan binding domain-containing protein n=1 Tax=Aliiroseovarius sediminilitoris TaxID=1173584 RepID=A0A1I0MGG5_9RHOB|nr:peptidoglycan-binding domain-containing protein [Aliiroseovarius sediminilitoris]SEV87457.1 Putative peptidoglycan binding domain-containing protein [Aliiroseovarius sediminilitoris]